MLHHLTAGHLSTCLAHLRTVSVKIFQRWLQSMTCLIFRVNVKWLEWLRKHAYSYILKILPPKKMKLFRQRFWYFSYFCSKHRLWVLASIHNLCFWAEIRKIMYTPVNPSFLIQKWGLRGSKLCRHVFVIKWYGCANWFWLFRLLTYGLIFIFSLQGPTWIYSGILERF